MDVGLMIALGVTHAIALVDVWISKLTTGAKVMWTLTLLFLTGVGLVAWLITRHSAHEAVEPIPAPE